MNFSPRRHGDTEETKATAPGAELVQSLQSHRLPQLIQSVWDIAKAILREVFDESAYERFLVRTGNARSVASYREFLREGEMAVASKPRCC